MRELAKSSSEALHEAILTALPPLEGHRLAGVVALTCWMPEAEDENDVEVIIMSSGSLTTNVDLLQVISRALIQIADMMFEEEGEPDAPTEG